MINTAKERQEFNVTVLSRRDVDTYPKLGVKVTQIWVTYVAAGLAPATIYIEKEKYNISLEKQAIREDIEKRLKMRPEAYRV